MSRILFGKETTEIEDDEYPELGITFATLAEDQIVMRFAKHLPVERWFYVDVGAFDPVKNSNTLLLFKRGWRGINIDANAESIARFNSKRPQDINIHAYLAGDSREMIYTEYESATTNRLVAQGSNFRSYKGEPPRRKTPIRTKTLAGILAECLKPADKIGYLNIDCEGLDLEILIGTDVNRWRPSIISIEGNTTEEQARVYEYMTQCNYELRANIIVTQVYTDKACPVMNGVLRYTVETK